MRRALFALLLWAPHSSALEIQLERVYQAGDPIIATVDEPPLNAQAVYKWTPSAGIKVREFDGGRTLAIWPHGAEHLLRLEAQYTIKVFTPDPEHPDDPTKAQLTELTLPPYHDDHQFVVEGLGPEPPQPALAELAGRDAAAIGSRLAALSRAVKAGSVPLDKFAAVLDGSLVEWAQNPALPVIKSRLAKLTDAAAIVAELDRIVAELGGGPGPGPTPVPSEATAATYIYEKDNTAIPAPVSAALNRLNRERKIVATSFEEDTLDGSGQVPDQYEVPLVAARAAGLPALVVTAGSNVLRVVKDPRTEQQVFEAIAP